MTRTKTAFIIVASALGVALWLSLGSHFLSIWEISTKRLLQSFLVLFLLGFVISLFFIQWIVQPHLKKYTPRIQAGWILLSLIVGLFLLFTIPTRLPEIPIVHTLKIIALSQKNELSGGSEVWLNSITTGNEVFSTHLGDICSGDWVRKDKHLVSMHNQPAELICTVRTAHNVSVRFRTTPQSGKVVLIFDDQIEERDLYTAKVDSKTINFKIAPAPKQMKIMFIVLLADWLWLSLFLLTASLWFITRSTSEITTPEAQPLCWFWYALPIMLVWSTYLLALWPGSMTTDSLGQWGEVLSGKFTDFHPAFHTLTIWLLTRFWSSPATVAIAQILVASGVSGWGVSLIRFWGAPKWLAWLVVGMIAISPVNGMMIITLWKDIPYSISVLALTLLILLVINSNGKWIENRAAWILFGIVAALAALYRHNGAIVSFGSLGCLLFVYRRQWRPVLAALVLALGLWMVVRGPIYQLAGVSKSQMNIFLGTPSIYVIDRHLHSGTPLLAEEQALLSQVRPVESGWPYNCYNLSELFADEILNTSFIANHSKELARLALNLTLRNPIETINHLICQNAFILQITQPPRSSYEYAPAGIYKNSFGLETASKFPMFRALILNEIPITGERRLNWLVWRTAFWMYLLIFASFIAYVRRKSWSYFLTLAPVLLNALSLFFSSGIQSLRYVYPTMLISILISGYLLLLPSKHPE